MGCKGADWIHNNDKNPCTVCSGQGNRSNRKGHARNIHPFIGDWSADSCIAVVLDAIGAISDEYSADLKWN